MKESNRVVLPVSESNQSTAAGRTTARSASEDGRASGEVEKGAPPTNRAPYKYNPEFFQPLRFGVDSLYLSYPGVLASDWENKLKTLKDMAQSEKENEVALAQVVICSHLFEVKDKGKGRFSYVLVDNCYHIQVSNGNAQALPLAYVQISSEYLATVDVEEAEKALSYIVNTLGVVKEPANISRADLFVDFVTNVELDKFHPDHWVTRSHSLDMHWRYGKFSGWSIGLGGDVSARLYDKTLEIEKKSKKYYLHDMWREAEWDGSSLVYRMEFQGKREPLKQLGVCKLNDLLRYRAELWQYFSQDWLRLAIPCSSDSNASRWPNHPLWDAISGVFSHGQEQARLKRFTQARIPSDERLFVHGLGGLTSFMARENIDDLGEGLGEFLAQADQYHESVGRHQGQNMHRYIQRKIKAKGRRYNTINNRKNHLGDKAETITAAQAYQEATQGESTGMPSGR